MASFDIFCCIILFVIATTTGLRTDSDERPIVTVTEGKLRGTVKIMIAGSSYYSFKGIPYAEAPVGDHRFEAPLPPKPWNETRDAAEHGPVCMQYDVMDSEPIGSEQCLFLNVYTTSLNSSSKLPVMVFIHGGSYDFGSGNTEMYTPDLLLQHDVILVTINYRLELLGYLTLDTPEIPGNAGMRDQVMALRWIKENIAKFGGDPNNVTIFGESSGGSAVTYLILSSMADGLFNKAIAQSGVCLQDWAIGKDMINRAFRAGKVLGKDTNDVNELLIFLRSLPDSNLTNLNDKSVTQEEKNRDLANRFVPVVERHFPDVQPFLDEDPADRLVARKVNKVPLLLGYNSGEGITLIETENSKLEVRDRNPSYFVPSNIAERLSEEQTLAVGKRIIEFYAGNSNFSKDHPEHIRDFSTDAYFAYNTHRFAYFYSSPETPVYMYKFNYQTELNIVTQILSKYRNLDGASHGDDLFYLFYNDLNKGVFDSEPTLRQITYKVTKLWTDFAKTGNPTPDESSDDVKWPAYSKDMKEYLTIQENFTVGSFADKHRMEFWNEIYREARLPYIGQDII